MVAVITDIPVFGLSVRSAVDLQKRAGNTTDCYWLRYHRESANLESRAVSVNSKMISNKVKANIVDFRKRNARSLRQGQVTLAKLNLAQFLSPRHGNNSQLLEE